MMKGSWVGVFGVIACLAGACGGYGNVAPGMTAAEVSKEMNGYGVSRIVPFGGGYSATYYGNDTCVLFKDEKVVGKDEATEQRQAIGLGNVDGRPLAGGLGHECCVAVHRIGCRRRGADRRGA